MLLSVFTSFHRISEAQLSVREGAFSVFLEGGC